MKRCLVLLAAALLAVAAPAGAKAHHRSVAPPPDQTASMPNPTGCDSTDTTACMLTFPNDLYTKANPATPTGRQIDFNVLAMPRNRAGKPIDPTDWNRADGFSPGSEIITKIPGLDTNAELDALNAPRIWDPERSLDADSPIQVIDADTGQRQMVWAELDHSIDALGAADTDRVLIIRPAKNLLEGHRYIVVLALGDKYKAASPVFDNYRDGTAVSETNPLQQQFDEQRRAHFTNARHTGILDELDGLGFDRKSLTQAWDFTVASVHSLAGRMLAIRNDAFHQLGDDNLADMKVQGKAPTFTLQRIIDYTCAERQGTPLDNDAIVVDGGCPGGRSTRPADEGTGSGDIAYDVKGTMDVPCYLSTPGCAPAHSQFVLDPSSGLPGTPEQIPGNVMKVDFECRIPQVALDHPGESRPSLYGHGLFGSYDELGQDQINWMASENNVTYCGTKWEGMAEDDIPNVATVLLDVSSFNTLADRVQQGMLNFLYLGRLMIHPDGLCSQAAFNSKGQCILDTRRLYYDGNSQGGIVGGALTAVAPDFNRSTLGVLGMNYSTLLTRSTDFGTGADAPSPTPDDPTNGVEYAYPVYQAYPQFNERQLLFSLMQMLWDRAEPDGYAQHMTDHPYADTPQHEVLLMSGYGDHQVSNVAAETEARTIGAKMIASDLRPWRPWEIQPFPGIPQLDRSQFPLQNASLFTIWDGGSRPSPLDNVAQSNKVDDDPHEWVRRTLAGREMKAAFLNYVPVDSDGNPVEGDANLSQVIDTCGEYCDTSIHRRSPNYAVDINDDPLFNAGVIAAHR
jgi:hypothetical protein